MRATTPVAMTAILLSPRALLWRHAMPDRSPEVFADEARRVLAALGHISATGDRAAGFEAVFVAATMSPPGIEPPLELR